MSTSLKCDLCGTLYTEKQDEEFHRVTIVDSVFKNKRVVKKQGTIDCCAKCFDNHIDSKDPLDFLTGGGTLQS